MRRFYLLAVLLSMMAALPTTPARAAGDRDGAGKLTATIGDFVWRDQNSNGIQDGGEPGLANVYVELQTAAGGWVNAVFTNANGGYSFTGVAPGTYRIKFANPGGFFQSPQDAGADDTKDNDADQNGFTPNFTVTAGQVISNIDGGFKPLTTSTCSLTLTGGASNKVCNDNGTPSNPNDDVYTFDFNATVSANPNGLPVWGYKLQINNMSFWGMYGMPTSVGPIPISAGNLTWTLVDDDNPTCTISGIITPPSTCSPGGTCPTSAVRTISNTPVTCGQTANLYGFWFSGLNANLSKEWLWESGNFIENSDGTASMIGVIYNKTKVNAKFAVDIKLTGRTFTAPSGSPKTDIACSGTSTSSWYYYTGISGNLTGINDPSANELAGASLEVVGTGPKPQFGTGASLRNTSANGGSTWLNYIIKMQPVNTSLQFSPNPTGSQGADINIQLSGTPLVYCPPTACNDVTTGGQIGSAEAGCPPFDPAAITETVAPTGGSGAFEYVWLSSTTGCPTTSSQMIAGATGASYDPGVISQTTWYVRCVKRAGCPDFVGSNHESNCIKKEVKTTGCNTGGTPDCNAIGITTGAGSITITGLVAPVIMVQAFNASWAQVFNQTFTTNPGTLTIPGFAAGSYYVKVNFLNSSWSAICQKDGYFTVPPPSGGCDDVTTGGTIGSDELACPPYDPANITETAAPAGGSGAFEYMWLSSTTGCPNDASQAIPGATGKTYDPGAITQKTWYRRCVRRAGCTSFVGANHESNCVVKDVKTSGCTTPCNLSINVSNLQCDGKGTVSTADDTYTFNFTVTGSGTGATWSGSFDNAYLGVAAFGPTAYGTVIPMGPFPAGAFTPGNVNPPTTLPNGVDINIHVNDTQNPGCSKSTTVTSPGPCSPTGGGTPDCSAITITPGASSITITGLTAPIIMVQVFNATTWAQVFNQTYSNSPGTVTIPSLANASYFVKVDFLNASWSPICKKELTVAVPPGGGGTCSLTLGGSEANKVCNNNGTPNTGADDTWTVDFTALVLTNPNNLPTWGWTATINGQTINGMYGMSKALGPFLISAGNLVFTYTDDDNPTCSTTITITPPAPCSTPTPELTFNCTNNITVTAATGATSAVVNYTAPTASSTCTVGSVSVVKTSGPASGSAFPVGTTTVCFKATDGCGNEKTCCFNVTVNPGTPSNCDSKTDGCIKVDLVSITTNANGSKTYSYKITSNCGYGLSYAAFQLPMGAVASAPGSTYTGSSGKNYSVENTTNNPFYSIKFNTTSADGIKNGQMETFEYTLPAGAPSLSSVQVQVKEDGTVHNVTLSTANCGGGSTGTLTFNCTNNITVTAVYGQNSAVVNYTAPTATTTCPGGATSVVKTSGPASGSSFPVGTTTVCFQASDACGNTKTCCFTVTVNPGSDPCLTDNVPPTINNCPGNQTLTVAAKYTASNTKKCGSSGTYGMWLDFGNSSLNHFNISNAMFWENADGSAKLTGVATSQGNANLKFNIDVTWTGRVTTPPSGSPKALDCTSQVSSYGTNIRFYTGMSGTLVGSGSASTGITFTLTKRGPAFQVGTGANLRENVLGASGWFSMSKSGSNSGCPTVTEGDFNFNITSTPNTATATWSAPTATDNCGTPTIVGSHTSGASFPVGTTTVSYTATDAKGNKSTCTFTITVNQVNPGGGNPGGGNMVDPTKCYYIKCKSNGKVCDAEDRDSWSSGTYCNQWPIDNTSSQKWKFEDAGNGYFYCISQNSSAFGKCLNVKDGSTADNALCNLITPNGADATKFCFQDAGNGYVYIVAKHSGKAFKWVSTSGSDGSNQCNNSVCNISYDHQKWQIVEVPCATGLVAPSNQLTFNAYRKGLNSELRWINNTGDRNEFFDIERSNDGGENFSKIGRVDGKGGQAGDKLYFQSFDRNPAEGDNIYRLKMVWKDGTVTYSEEQTVRFDVLPALGIYPNPAADELFVDLSQFAGEKVELALVNNLGVRVLAETIEKAEDDARRLDIRDVPSGSYRLFIQPEGNRPEVRQVVVEKF